MITSSELVECKHCHSWFTDTSLDDLFFHGTSACGQLALIELQLSALTKLSSVAQA